MSILRMEDFAVTCNKFTGAMPDIGRDIKILLYRMESALGKGSWLLT